MNVPGPSVEPEYTRRRCANCGYIFDGRGSCPKCGSNATDPRRKKPTWEGSGGIR